MNIVENKVTDIFFIDENKNKYDVYLDLEKIDLGRCGKNFILKIGAFSFDSSINKDCFEFKEHTYLYLRKLLNLKCQLESQTLTLEITNKKSAKVKKINLVLLKNISIEEKDGKEEIKIDSLSLYVKYKREKDKSNVAWMIDNKKLYLIF